MARIPPNSKPKPRTPPPKPKPRTSSPKPKPKPKTPPSGGGAPNGASVPPPDAFNSPLVKAVSVGGLGSMLYQQGKSGKQAQIDALATKSAQQQATIDRLNREAKERNPVPTGTDVTVGDEVPFLVAAGRGADSVKPTPNTTDAESAQDGKVPEQPQPEPVSDGYEDLVSQVRANASSVKQSQVPSGSFYRDANGLLTRNEEVNAQTLKSLREGMAYARRGETELSQQLSDPSSNISKLLQRHQQRAQQAMQDKFNREYGGKVAGSTTPYSPSGIYSDAPRPSNIDENSAGYDPYAIDSTPIDNTSNDSEPSNEPNELPQRDALGSIGMGMGTGSDYAQLVRDALKSPEPFDFTTAGVGPNADRYDKWRDYIDLKNEPYTASQKWADDREDVSKKSGLDIASDVLQNVGQFADEAVRTIPSLQQHGLARTITGRGNVSGFGAGTKGFVGEGVSVLKDTGKAVAKNFKAGSGVAGKTGGVAKGLVSQGGRLLNTGMAAANVAGGIASGIEELTGSNYDPLSAIFSGGKSWGRVLDEDGKEVKMDENGNPILNIALDEEGNPILDPQGNPVRVPIRKGIRSGAHDKEFAENPLTSWLPESVRGVAAKTAGFSEAALNTLSMGGYDAMRSNIYGGDAYVRNRKGQVDQDPYNVGKGMEWITGKILGAIDDWQHPKSAARLQAEAERRMNKPAPVNEAPL